jgi:hypothetical protein
MIMAFPAAAGGEPLTLFLVRQCETYALWGGLRRAKESISVARGGHCNFLGLLGSSASSALERRLIAYGSPEVMVQSTRKQELK